MLKKLWTWALPLLMLTASVSPVAAQSRGGDIGEQMEREYGVLSRNTGEGRRLNDQFDQVVDRIVDAVNARGRRQGEAGNFRLRSAKILGGRSEKHDQVVNAFALPDGRIYVTLGLMRAVQNSPRAEDELAFVVGHEVTHVTERHSAHQQREALKAGLFGVLLGTVTRSREAATLGRGLGAAYVSSFSRKDEYEADEGGLLAMKRAGYDLNAAISMLRRLAAQGESRNRMVNGWFGSHPLTENRIDRIREMIDRIENRRGERRGLRSTR